LHLTPLTPSRPLWSLEPKNSFVCATVAYLLSNLKSFLFVCGPEKKALPQAQTAEQTAVLLGPYGPADPKVIEVRGQTQKC
jgi:hypothetical protein